MKVTFVFNFHFDYDYECIDIIAKSNINIHNA